MVELGWALLELSRHLGYGVVNALLFRITVGTRTTWDLETSSPFIDSVLLGSHLVIHILLQIPNHLLLHLLIVAVAPIFVLDI
jgi:hypothetical protein